MVQNAPPIHKALNSFIEFIADYPLVVYNAPFDMGFINYYLRKPLNNPVFDLLIECKKIYFFESYKLENVANNLEVIPSESFHRALPDSEVTAKIYLRCIKDVNNEELKKQQQKTTKRREVNFNESSARPHEILKHAKRLEKNGDIQEAILLYEQLIEDEFDAPLPYDRLRINYRKQSLYNEEIRVIQKGLYVFEREGESKFLEDFNMKLKKAKSVAEKNKR